MKIFDNVFEEICYGKEEDVERKSRVCYTRRVQSSMKLIDIVDSIYLVRTVSGMIFIRGRGEMPLKKRSDPVGKWGHCIFC